MLQWLYNRIKDLCTLFLYQFLFFYIFFTAVEIYFEKKNKNVEGVKFRIDRECYAHMLFSFLYFVLGGVILFGIPFIFPLNIMIHLFMGSVFVLYATLLDRALLEMWKQEDRKTKID